MRERMDRTTMAWLRMAGILFVWLLTMFAVVVGFRVINNVTNGNAEEEIISEALDKSQSYTVVEKSITAGSFGTKNKMIIVVENKSTQERYDFELEKFQCPIENKTYETFCKLVVGDTFKYKGEGVLELEGGEE